MPNVVELGKQTYKYVGEMLAVSLIHSGPAPGFFAPSVADYIIHGMRKVRAMATEVPDPEMAEKLQKMCVLVSVCVFVRYYVFSILLTTVSMFMHFLIAGPGSDH